MILVVIFNLEKGLWSMEEVSLALETKTIRVSGIETQIVEKTKITLRSSER